ncbi:MAG: hypothetical protein HQL54_12385 [Magnetococcales bacterium]|nr:hypothetical protein [Magnetococcales bacterium]
MAVYRLQDMQPGMILISDVRDRSGRLLLAKGKDVNARHLNIFKMWGVTEADVEVPKLSADDGDDDVSVNQDQNKRLKQAEILFRFADPSSPLVKELFRQFVQRPEKVESY